MNLTEEQRAAAPCFVGFGACGHIKACAVDTPEFANENAKCVASWMRSGLRIEKMPVSEVRVGKWCDCPSVKKARKEKPTGVRSEKS